MTQKSDTRANLIGAIVLIAVFLILALFGG